MITGYNTDIRHGDVVFHVQTEDKGLGNPCIESLVYVGGQVLATKRASYADLLAEGKDDKEIVALMDHQHRTMIAAIRHGKLDTKMNELLAGRKTGAHSAMSSVLETGETILRSPGSFGAPMSPGSSSSSQVPVPPEMVVPVAPPPPAPPRKSPERSLDQVILEYLTSEADQEQLVLLLEEGRDLKLGAQANLVVRATSSKNGQAVAGTQVSVRMISTVAAPRILASGKADQSGLLALQFDIPEVGRGTSALIVSAVSGIGRAELKHLL
jgi:hypothetical protein